MNAFYLIACSIALIDMSASDDPKITFDTRPELGIPVEARMHEEGSRESMPWSEVIGDKIEAVQIRYYDKEVWETEEKVQEYISHFLKTGDMEVRTRRMWAQGVGIPDIECKIRFKKQDGTKYRKGELLIWDTVACFRDDQGNWKFISAANCFHLHHPKADPERKASLQKKNSDQ